jgi:hypothetical protein
MQEVAVVGFEGVLESLEALAGQILVGLALVLLGGDPKIRSVPGEADFLQMADGVGIVKTSTA